MRKGLFLSVPSISVDKTLTPVVDDLCESGYDIIRYNTPAFAPKGTSRRWFKPYPSCYTGFDTARMSRLTSYFDYAEMLLDTAVSLREFLREEVESEAPDFILHSHLALWGKALAACYRMPAVALYSTFVLDSRIMIPEFRAQRQEGSRIVGDMQQFVRCRRKYRALYDTVDASQRPEVWDAYVNREPLNVSFTLEAFQERIDLFGPPEYRYVGHPSRATPRDGGDRRLIYMALGTILNDDVALFKLGLSVFARLDYPCLIVLGKVPKEALGPVPEHVSVAEFVDQERVLGDAAIFITMGGMASVHEAVSALTPMIVIPETPEQHITARRIEALGIGVRMNREQMTEEALLAVIRQMLKTRTTYDRSLRALKASGPAGPPAALARAYIMEYLQASSVARCEQIVS
jgi:MGT family glycosyltransferase